MTEIFLTDELTEADKKEELDSIREKLVNYGADINPIETSSNLTKSFMAVMEKAPILWVKVKFHLKYTSLSFICTLHRLKMRTDT